VGRNGANTEKGGPDILDDKERKDRKEGEMKGGEQRKRRKTGACAKLKPVHKCDIFGK